MGGVVGQFFKPFGLTVSAAVLISLLVARTLSPLLAVYWLKPATAHQQDSKWLGFSQSYQNLLGWSLQHRWIVVGLALLSLIVGLALIPLIPKGFIPKLDRGEFNINYIAALPEVQGDRGTRGQGDNLASGIQNLQLFDESLQVAKKLEDVVRRSPQVQNVFTIVGSRQGEPNKGALYVKLKKDRTLNTAQVQAQLRSALPALSGVTTSIEDIQFVDTGGEPPLSVTLVGEDLKKLNRTAKTIKEKVQKLPGFVDVTATGEANQSGTIIEIQHLNARRVARVSANLGQNMTLGNASDRLVAETKAVLPPNISLDLGGDAARSNDVLSSFGITLALSVLCIMFVLILLFKSWLEPLVIIFSLPLSIVGAMLGLLVSRSDFGMISLIGIIFLLGLINKNAILLVDYINQLRQSGMHRTAAILTAGPIRLRPILMTTSATILGMLPLALGFGAGAELRSPMAVAIIGGLITSTLLSLIVVPAIYVILDDWHSKVFKGKRFS